MSVEILKEGNNSIVYVNHQGLSGSKLISNFAEANKILINGGQDQLLLTDFRNASLSKEVIDYIKSDETKAASGNCKKQAIVGITGIKKMILNVYNGMTKANMKIFNTFEEAKEYLLK